jgi:signal peptidase complex subunit 3
MWARSNAVFFFSLFVLWVLAMGSAVTTLWLPNTYSIKVLELKHLKTLRPQRESLQRGEVTDRAILTFDLDADLRGVFNWNVKQLFVYITAQYRTPANGFNEVVIWDKVVNRSADAHLKLFDAFNKYPVIDQKTNLRNTPVTLALNWDVMPIAGPLYKRQKAISTIRMPPVYCTEAECQPEPIDLEIVDRRPPRNKGKGGVEVKSSEL